ncbi:MAG TPA: acyl-CoA thioesterase II, partial [Cytophagales bacterium]|nr:acyl-CoA thioesterase II [Cytophagales bacterium]
VVAVQNGSPIFNMSCSFQIEEDGLEHKDEMPEVTHHSKLMTDLELMDEHNIQVPPEFKRFLSSRFFAFKPVQFINPFDGKSYPASRSIWLKCSEEIPDHLAFHQEALAFVSDFNLLTTATLPYGDRFKFGQLQMASLDHAMWLHRPFRVGEWLLYDMESPSASNSRGVNFGKIFREDGTLVATVAQEGLMRVRS